MALETLGISTEPIGGERDRAVKVNFHFSGMNI